MPRGARTRPEALHAAWDPQPDLPCEEPAHLARRVLEPGAVVLRPDRGRRLPAVPAPALHIERRRLRRPADAHGRRPRALPRRAREVAEGVSLHPRRRVPGHEPCSVPAAATARGEAPQPDGGRRPGPVHLRVPRRRHHQHPRLRAGLSGHAHDRAGAELPLDQLDPRRRQRGDHEQPRAKAQGALVGPRRRRAGARRRSRGRARRGAVRRRRHRVARRAGLRGRRDRDLLPDECAVTRARGRPRPPGCRLPGDRRPALLRTRRDQGCDRVPAGDRQPVRRRLAATDRQQAAPWHRRFEPGAPADLGRLAGTLALGGARVRRGGRASEPRRSKPCRDSAR